MKYMLCGHKRSRLRMTCTLSLPHPPDLCTLSMCIGAQADHFSKNENSTRTPRLPIS
jgi:hypothetical protein